MTNQSDPLEADCLFFASLLEVRLDALDQLLSDDFILVDVMSGSEVAKSSLFSAMKSGQLKFEAIELVSSHVRLYQATAVILGRTQMKGWFGDLPFNVSSRYTHVYVEDQGRWRMVAAQGTLIAPGSGQPES
jgi:hypothetical protein